jgi:hypothetical protein
LLPGTQLARIAATYAYDRAHVARIDPRRPGIAAPIAHDGQVLYVVIDGIHRAVRAHETGQPFCCDVLTDADEPAIPPMSCPCVGEDDVTPDFY